MSSSPDSPFSGSDALRGGRAGSAVAMTAMQKLEAALRDVIGDGLVSLVKYAGEITVEIDVARHAEIALRLRDDARLRFDTLIDLCGVDYSGYQDGAWQGRRYAVVLHLLSVQRNQRVRVRAFCPDDELPLLPSVIKIWAATNWFEREAFDLYGIVFEGHPDLRRILTDYGFIGHPFRKDFPLSGYTEMRYDAERQRVIYQPVTIEPREITPRVVREEKYAGFGGISVQQTQTHG